MVEEPTPEWLAALGAQQELVASAKSELKALEKKKARLTKETEFGEGAGEFGVSGEFFALKGKCFKLDHQV